MVLKLSHSYWKNTLMILLYKAIGEIIYIRFISPAYSYRGFITDINIGKLIVSYVLVMIASFFIDEFKQRNKTSDNIVILISEIYFIPGLSIIALCNIETGYMLFFSVMWVLILTLQIQIGSKPLLPKLKIKNSKFAFLAILWGLTVLSLTLSGWYTGFRFSLEISTVYDLRIEAREYNVPILIQYAQNSALAVLPLGIMYYFEKKKYLLAGVIVFIQLLNFSFNGLKSTLLITIFSIIFGIIHERKWNKLYELFLTFIFGLGYIMSRLGQRFVSATILRRTFFLPPYIGYLYYDFMHQSNHPLLLLRASVLRYFGASNPYGMPFPRLIGLTYFNNLSENVNNGLCGDAFSNFGWLSLLFYPLLYILLLRLLDRVSQDVPVKPLVVLWIFIAVKFTNSSFFTMLLNGGVLMLVIMLCLYPQSKNKSLIEIGERQL